MKKYNPQKLQENEELEALINKERDAIKKKEYDVYLKVKQELEEQSKANAGKNLLLNRFLEKAMEEGTEGKAKNGKDGKENKK